MGGVSVSLLIDRARTAGLSLAVEDGKLVINGPKRAGAIAGELIGRKAEVIAALRPPPEPEPEPAPVPDPENDPEAIVIPREGYAVRVAGLPHDDWMRWRRRADEIQRELGHAPSAGEIFASYSQAAAELDF